MNLWKAVLPVHLACSIPIAQMALESGNPSLCCFHVERELAGVQGTATGAVPRRWMALVSGWPMSGRMAGNVHGQIAEMGRRSANPGL